MPISDDRLAQIMAIPDEAIDTSDIPEATAADFAMAKRYGPGRILNMRHGDRCFRFPFWFKFRYREEPRIGREDVTMVLRRGEAVDPWARKVVAQALAQFNQSWPGAHRDEMVCVGMIDEVTGAALFGHQIPETGGALGLA